MINRFIMHVHFGVIVIILHSIEFRKLQALSSNSTLNCNCMWVKSLKMANCSGNTKIFKVPRNCGEYVKTLDLSNIIFDSTETFDGAMFEYYSGLQQLYMRKIKKWPVFCPTENKQHCRMVFKKDVFIPLISLEVLDLSHIDGFIMEKSMKWPPKLQILYLTGSKIAEIPSMAYLEHFIEFNGAQNRFHKLPKFNTLFPIINHIELNNNPLDNLNVSEIAPFCSLKYLGIRVTFDGTFSRPSKYCHCIRLRKWMIDKAISGYNNFFCNTGDGKMTEKSCLSIMDMSFSAEHQLYDECMNNIAGTSVWELLFFAVLFSVLFPVLYFASQAFNNYFYESKEFVSTRALDSSSARRSNHSSMTDHDYDYEYDDHNHDLNYEDHEDDHHGRHSYVNDAGASFLPVLMHAENV